MKQFLAVRSASDRSIRSVQVFEESDHIEAAVARDLAREVDGQEAELFLGSDLLDVIQSHEAFFEEGRS